MNPRWLLIRRLRGPAYLLTFGVTALLHQWDVLGFGESWPLYLIVAGLLSLAERAALAGTPVIPYGVPSTAPFGAQAPYGVPSPSQTPYQPVGTAVVPAPPAGLDVNDPHRRP